MATLLDLKKEGLQVASGNGTVNSLNDLKKLTHESGGSFEGSLNDVVKGMHSYLSANRDGSFNDVVKKSMCNFVAGSGSLPDGSYNDIKRAFWKGVAEESFVFRMPDSTLYMDAEPWVDSESWIG